MWRPTAASVLLLIVLSLITLGVVILYSTSGILGQAEHQDAFWYLKRQGVWIALAFFGFLVAARIDYQFWRTFSVPIALLSLASLIVAILPGIGEEIGGSRRWLRVGPINFQPSEVAKLASIMLLAWWMARAQRDASSVVRGLLIPLTFVGVFSVLILLEPDYGTTMLVAAVGMAIMFVGGTRIGYILVSGVTGLCGMALLIAHNQERRTRVLAFLDPQAHERDDAWQLIQALYAFVVGGGTGVGLGMSIQKRLYLPEAHTDFIFAILGEELGLRFTLPVVLMYFLFFLCGVRIAGSCEDRFGKLLGFGITLLITVQAALNIGVVTGSLPTKGITLPFISYGGSSMLMSLVMIGILINISLDVPEGQKEEDRRFVKDRAHHI